MFKQTKVLIKQMDEYLDAVSQSGILFNLAINEFLKNEYERFNVHLLSLTEAEHQADKLKRKIENDLYVHSLIPEYRGDVMRLLERLDEIIDTAKEVVVNFDIERPVIMNDMTEMFSGLADIACKAVDSTVSAARMYFNHPSQIRDHLHKIYFYEKEADHLSDNLKRKIFNHPTLELSHKMHLRYFVARTDLLADTAESAADMLSVYSIKLSV
ncbi:MAG TPA: DUF47 family protein [Bacteroidia bacterium]|nr:DUF47 family protein [Sphingobacteriales bacterium]HPD64995.1 DUF47 family protein [Bacteroidia bacterium]HRS58131.1 DUF47 family protein [Bacteroidia bacterium]HRU68758.1 DUF47 family protein [Bacteroidia bacterium]